MSRKKIIVIALCAVLAIGLVSFGVYAATSYGTQDDPLITKSYLDSVLAPQIEEQVQAEIEAALEKIESEPVTGGDDFTVLTLTTGQTVTCGVGCEVMLRIGSATAVGDDYPVLVDTTSGESVANGANMTANHLYMVTIIENGFKATSETTKVLIKGDYTVN